MIRGRFMTSNDDCSAIFALRERVFVRELGFSANNVRDAYDDMAYYALVFDERDVPSGTGRLALIDDRFVLGKMCVLPSVRGQGMGDLLMRMLLLRAQEMNAPAVYIRARLDAVPFYERYGFKLTDENEDVEGQPHIWLRALADEIDIEGSCHKEAKDCPPDQNCASCGGCDEGNKNT
ncbi:GNAT family N-acetyltransferase [Eubacteriales bacterium OttesenSCG-928-N13]|nr:GNAT family N-acetyltransferase [Eubacteriales bacterium OttesenSCG-928-N13]